MIRWLWIRLHTTYYKVQLCSFAAAHTCWFSLQIIKLNSLSTSNISSRSSIPPSTVCVLMQFYEFNWVQTQWRLAAVSSADFSVCSGNSSCSLWKSGPGSGMHANPGVQPCTPARHSVVQHSLCGLSSVQQGHPHRLYGYGHEVKGMPSCMNIWCWFKTSAEDKIQCYGENKW